LVLAFLDFWPSFRNENVIFAGLVVNSAGDGMLVLIAAHLCGEQVPLSGVRKQRIGFQKGLGLSWRLSGNGR
jgi:hypothetical protein